MGWRDYKIGQELVFETMGKQYNMTVKEIQKDHAICAGDNARVRIDDDNEFLFTPIEKDDSGNVVHKNVISGRW